MKTNLLGMLAGVISLGAAGAASAADMAVKARPLPPPVPVFSWTGFYVGANAGYAWGNGDTFYNPLPTAIGFANLAPTTLGVDTRGWLAGVQAGYNWQSGQFVFGVEADIQGAEIKGSAFQTPIIQNNGTPFGAGSFLATTEKLKWLGTARVRLGFAASSPLLLYVTGGLAYGEVDYTANTSFLPVGSQAYPAAFSDTRVGWTAGAGAEWAFAPNWSAKIEGLWYDLGKTSVIANGVPGQPAGTCGNAPQFCQVGYSWKTEGVLARVGINYRFGGPVVARY